jgi:beta-lactamase regulating signal transducer with metallopeptidase domain
MLWWTLQNLVVATVLAGVVQVLCRAARIGPVGRHALWLIVMVKLVTPPLLVLHLPDANIAATKLVPGGGPISSLSRRADSLLLSSPHFTPGDGTADGAQPGRFSSTAPTDSGALRSSDVAAVPPRETSRTFDRLAASAAVIREWRPWLGWLWLAGAIAFASIQSIRIGRIVRGLRLSKLAGGLLAADVEALAQRLGMRSVPIRVVPGLPSPFVWCVHRTVLLWPADLPTDMSESSRRGLIVHELAHVKRRDHWVGWIELAAGCVWWWNPLFWYVRCQLRENAELACDAWAVETLPHGRRAYAEALLAVCAGLAPSTPMPAVGIGTGSRRVLERRLVMIMRERVPLRLSRVGISSIALVALATLPAWAQTTATRTTAPVERPVVPVTSAAQPARAIQVVPTRYAVVQRQPAPADAQALIDRFAVQQAEAHREAEEKIARQRHDLIGKLQQIQDVHTKAGRLDEAVAVRDTIRMLTRQAAVAAGTASRMQFVPAPAWSGMAERAFPAMPASTSVTPITPPVSLQGLRGRVGQTMTLPVIGSTEGTVWGNGVYTDDSSLAVAAVHAGVVAPGRLGFARVTILPGQDHYDGVRRNDVTSQPYDAWSGSFKVERDPDPSPVIRLDADDAARLLSLQSLRGQTGASLTVEIVGAASGESLWGSDEYTDDSSLAMAAVHAGILRPGERGLVKVTITPGRDSYAGSERNGVRSEPYARWDGSFKVERATKPGGA